MNGAAQTVVKTGVEQAVTGIVQAVIQTPAGQPPLGSFVHKSSPENRPASWPHTNIVHPLTPMMAPLARQKLNMNEIK